MQINISKKQYKLGFLIIVGVLFIVRLIFPDVASLSIITSEETSSRFYEETGFNKRVAVNFVNPADSSTIKHPIYSVSGYDVALPASTTNINCVNVKPNPSSPPANILAEKNVNPNITDNIFQNPLRFDCGTDCHENSTSSFAIIVSSFLPNSDTKSIQKKRSIARNMTINLFFTS